jgi:3-hydroxyacyl-[acyl-carrier-protein] dehydratase
MSGKEMDAILAALPHRYPFLLVDTVLELERGTRIVALKSVSANEPFFMSLGAGRWSIPGLLIVEALAQAGAILLLAEQPPGSNRVAYFASLDNVQWPAAAGPGDQIRLEVRAARQRGRLHKVHGRALVGDTLVCEADLGAVLVDR